MSWFVVGQNSTVSTELSVVQLVTVAAAVLSVVLLAWSVSRGLRRSRLRPRFDLARVGLQTVAAIALPFLTGVRSSVAVVLGALAIGGVLGFAQGQRLQVEVDGGRLYTTRSAIGFAIWAIGLIAVQAAGLANRSGLVEVGQAITWFSIGVTVGLLVGRKAGVDRASQMLSAPAALAMVFAMFTLGACVDAATVDAVVAPDGSVQFTIALGDLLEEGETQECTPDPGDDGFPGATYSTEFRDGLTWCVISIPFGTTDDFRLFFEGLAADSDGELTVNCIAFIDDVLVVDVAYFLSAEDLEESIVVPFRITVPGELGSTNADAVEGRTATWFIGAAAGASSVQMNVDENGQCSRARMSLVLQANADNSGTATMRAAVSASEDVVNQLETDLSGARWTVSRAGSTINATKSWTSPADVGTVLDSLSFLDGSEFDLVPDAASGQVDFDGRIDLSFYESYWRSVDPELEDPTFGFVFRPTNGVDLTSGDWTNEENLSFDWSVDSAGRIFNLFAVTDANLAANTSPGQSGDDEGADGSSGDGTENENSGGGDPSSGGAGDEAGEASGGTPGVVGLPGSSDASSGSGDGGPGTITEEEALQAALASLAAAALAGALTWAEAAQAARELIEQANERRGGSAPAAPQPATPQPAQQATVRSPERSMPGVGGHLPGGSAGDGPSADPFDAFGDGVMDGLEDAPLGGSTGDGATGGQLQHATRGEHPEGVITEGPGGRGTSNLIDTDGDGVPDREDVDWDNDGVYDQTRELDGDPAGGPGEFRGLHPDGEPVPASSESSDPSQALPEADASDGGDSTDTGADPFDAFADGVMDRLEDAPVGDQRPGAVLPGPGGQGTSRYVDEDGDGVPDREDLDLDDDGIVDASRRFDGPNADDWVPRGQEPEASAGQNDAGEPDGDGAAGDPFDSFGDRVMDGLEGAELGGDEAAGSAGGDPFDAFADSVMDRVEDAPVGDNAPTHVIPGPMGQGTSRLIDEDGDGVPDREDLDWDDDGIVDATARRDPSTTGPDPDLPEIGEVLGEYPGIFGGRTRVVDVDGDGVGDIVQLDEDSDGTFEHTLPVDDSEPPVTSPTQAAGNQPTMADGGNEEPMASAGPAAALPEDAEAVPSGAEPGGDGAADTPLASGAPAAEPGVPGAPVASGAGDPAPLDEVPSGESPQEPAAGYGAGDGDGYESAEPPTVEPDEPGGADSGTDLAPPTDKVEVSPQEIDDIYRRGLANGRSLDDLRQDIGGLSEARGGTGDVADPYGLEERATSNGTVPLTAAEHADYQRNQRDLALLEAERTRQRATWDMIQEQRQALADRDLTREGLTFGLADQADALAAAEKHAADYRWTSEWLETHRRWDMGETWWKAPDGSSWYDAGLTQEENAAALERHRSAHEWVLAQQRNDTLEALNQHARTTAEIDEMQEQLMGRLRELDGAIDRAERQVDLYESWAHGSRPLPGE